MRILLLVSLSVVGFFGVSPSIASAHGSGHTRPDPTTTHTDPLQQASRLLPRRSGRSVIAAAASSRLIAPASCGSAGGPGGGDSAPSISLVYAVPSGQPNRFRRTATVLQAAAVEIGRFIAGQSGGRKTVRFTTGTSCGPRYLRVEFVRLGRPRAAYLDPSGVPAAELVSEEVERALPAPGGPRNRLVYVDGMVGRAAGVAQVLNDDRPGPANAHNAGGLFAFVWGERRAPSPSDVPAYAHLMLHELTHNLGGVQRSAPHTTGEWHCADGSDVMCYDDGGSTSRQRTACGRRSGTIARAFDCNQDDYFNPSPAPGSYLSTHWNVYDSAFLGSCRELRAACGESRYLSRK